MARGTRRDRQYLSPDSPFTTEAGAAALIGVAEKTLLDWRLEDSGPPYLRIHDGVIRYEKAAVIEWARKQTSDAVRPQRQAGNDPAGSAEVENS